MNFRVFDGKIWQKSLRIFKNLKKIERFFINPGLGAQLSLPYIKFLPLYSGQRRRWKRPREFGRIWLKGGSQKLVIRNRNKKYVIRDALRQQPHWLMTKEHSKLCAVVPTQIYYWPLILRIIIFNVYFYLSNFTR